MRQSVEGDGYRVTLIDDIYTVGPGLALVLSGRWDIGEVTLARDESAVLLDYVLAQPLNVGATLGVFEPKGSVLPAETKVTEKPWGAELEVVPTIGLLKKIIVTGGNRTSLQSHEKKDEVLFPLMKDSPGRLEVALSAAWLQNATRPVPVTEPTHIEPGKQHRVTGPQELLEGSTYHPDDVIRHQDDFGR